jgi:hypothetical protein
MYAKMVVKCGENNYIMHFPYGVTLLLKLAVYGALKNGTGNSQATI